MIKFTIQRDISRPAAAVFAFISDPAQLPRWQTNTVSAVVENGGALRLGARIHEVHRAPGGKQLSSVVEVTEFEHDRLLSLEVAEGALPIHARILLEQGDDATRLHFEVHGRPRAIMRVLEPLLRRTLRRQFAGYCDNLRRLLEEE